MSILVVTFLYMYWGGVECIQYVSWLKFKSLFYAFFWKLLLFPFLQAIMEQANRCGNDLAKLKDILSSILLICKVFYSLNFQVIIFMPS